MNIRGGLAAIAAAIAFCGTVFGVGMHLIPQKTPVVDGVIDANEWSKCEWVDLSIAYTKLGSAVCGQWAAQWSPATNLIYVAAVVYDVNQALTNSWIDANGIDFQAVFADVNYVDPAGGRWSSIGDGTVMPAGDIVAYATKRNGTQRTYELAIKPYVHYHGSGITEPNTVLTLRRGNVIGLDVAVTSRASDSPYGNLSNDGSAEKFDDAATLTKHRLSIKGRCGGFAVGDLNQDCQVSFADVAMFAAVWLADGEFVPADVRYGAPFFLGTWTTGTWYSWPMWSSKQQGASVGARFKGTGVRFTGNLWTNGGDANVYIDGNLISTENLHGDVNSTPVWFDYSGLTDGEHVITVKVADSGTANSVNVRGFVPLNPGELIIDANNQPIGDITQWKGDSSILSGPFYYSDCSANAYIYCTFQGTGVQYVAASSANSGIAGVTIDKGAEEFVDLYTGQPEDTPFTWTKAGLSSGTHVIKIRVAKEQPRNPASKGQVVSVVRIVPLP